VSKLITTINPANGKPLKTYESMNQQQVEIAIREANAAALAWGQEPLEMRVTAVRRLATELRRHSESLTKLITAEMGKPLGESAGEIEKSAVTATYYADNAGRILDDEKVEVNGVDVWVSYEPIGLVLAIMPWNFPVWQVMRFAIPAITAGNGVLLKHSPNVTGCALALEQLFLDAGLPKSLLTTLVIAEEDVPSTIKGVINDDRIYAVTLTGSNRAGAAVGAAAGSASKKAVLELGGSDAFIVLDDADIPAAAAAAVKARFQNAGQSCVCGKRFIVSKSIQQEFTDLFVKGARALIVGDPTDNRTQVGPLARGDLRDALQRQVTQSIGSGATLLTGGKPIPGQGYFYEPTILGNTRPGMAVFDEETFGPVAAISVADNDQHAIQLANATSFGLSLSIWTSDISRGVKLAKRITSGAAFINAITASDARVPFGGTKKSGYGRELSSAGIREFTNIRTFWVAPRK
jgi:succinate-semialdehyde dehydrogenase/glutarate-semialdehyde dehydrogenase